MPEAACPSQKLTFWGAQWSLQERGGLESYVHCKRPLLSALPPLESGALGRGALEGQAEPLKVCSKSCQFVLGELLNLQNPYPLGSLPTLLMFTDALGCVPLYPGLPFLSCGPW